MIELSQVSIRRGEFELPSLDFSVAEGEYAVLMGPTGCGKTTVLEAICGLQKVRSGSIIIDGVDVTNAAPAKRGIGYVPQDQTLFPTMRIHRQIEFGLAIRKASAALRKSRVDELAELTGIGPLLKRFPQGLSGGERQRVALARALSFRPRLICLDEPLSALDDDTRNQISNLLQTIHQQEKVTVLHITHNEEDATQLSTVKFQFVGSQIQRNDRE